MNPVRNGNFNSSEIVALTSRGKRPMTDQELAEYKKDNPKSRVTTIEDGLGEKAFTFIEECNMERRLNGCVTEESNAKPLAWGKFVEGVVFDLIGTEYSLTSSETIVHPKYPFWVGSPDGSKSGNTVMDIKSPFTRKSFCRLVNPLYDGLTGIDAMNALRFGYIDKNGMPHDKHKDGEKYYWQLVSNAILLGVPNAELIVYCPYESELPVIIDMANGNSSMYWLNYASKEELPYIPEGSIYTNINSIEFEVPKKDIQFLESQVVLASKYLI